MTRIEMEQAVASNLGLIRGVIVKTLKKYGSKLCEADVDDIESNTVLCLLDGRLDNYDYTTPKKLQTWIGYIAMQRCVDYLRALKSSISFQEEVKEGERISKAAMEMLNLTDSEELALDTLVDAEHQLDRRRRLRAAVASLSEDDQQAYAAMTSAGYSTRVYAQSQGIKESSVHTRRHRLLKNLRKCV